MRSTQISHGAARSIRWSSTRTRWRIGSRQAREGRRVPDRTPLRCCRPGFLQLHREFRERSNSPSLRRGIMPQGALVLRTNSEKRERGRFGGWDPPRLGRPQPSAASARQQPRPSGTHASLRAVGRCRAPPSVAPRPRLHRTSKRTPPPTPSRQSPTSGRAFLLRLRRHGQEAYASSAQSENPAIGRIRARAGPRCHEAPPGPPTREVTNLALVGLGWTALHVSRLPVGCFENSRQAVSG